MNDTEITITTVDCSATPDSKSYDKRDADGPTHTELHTRLVQEGIIARPADLKQTAETARDTLASIHATNGNRSIDDTEPRRKTLACGCSTSPGSVSLVKALNDVWDRVDQQRHADDTRVKIAEFKVNAA